LGLRGTRYQGSGRNLHNEELNDQYSSPEGNKIEENEMGGACSAYGEENFIYIYVYISKL